MADHFYVSIKDPGGTTKKGYPVLLMAVVGGAVYPVRMGRIADISLICCRFKIPMVCFAFIAWYAFFSANGAKNK